MWYKFIFYQLKIDCYSCESLYVNSRVTTKETPIEEAQKKMRKESGEPREKAITEESRDRRTTDRQQTIKLSILSPCLSIITLNVKRQTTLSKDILFYIYVSF